MSTASERKATAGSGVAVAAAKAIVSYETFVNAYLVLLSVNLVLLGVQNVREFQSWAIADWLINYHAGFVRRGLPGEVFLVIARFHPGSAPWLVLAAQLSCYLILMLVFRRLVLDSSRSAWVTTLLLSPATLSFPLFSYAYGYRKEILFFACLAALIYLLLYKRLSDSQIVVCLSVALPAMVLSHESIFFYLPYFFAALLIATESWRRTLIVFLLPSILSLAALLLATSHPGNLAIARGVCTAVGFTLQGYNGPCGGSIFWLTDSRPVAHGRVLHDLASYPVFRTYSLLAALSLLPVLMGVLHFRRFPSLRSRVRVLLAAMLCSGLFSVAVLFYAVDWGRFIYMHIIAAGLLLLMIEKYKQNEPQTHEAFASLALRRNSALVWAALVLYASCWNLPPTPLTFPTPPLGMVWKIYRLKSWSRRILVKRVEPIVS